MTAFRRSLLASVLGLVILAPVLLMGAAPANADEDVDMTVTIDGENIDDSSSSDPIELDPETESLMIVTVENLGDEEVVVDWIRMGARVFSLVFVATDTFVRAEVIDPGMTVRFEVPLRFFDLGSQATGLLPAEVAIYDTNRDQIARETFTLDVSGSLWSVQGGLTIVLLIIAIWSGALLVRAIWRGTLPVNRLMRGLRFAAFGLSVGLFLSFAVGVFRIVAPYASVWIPLILIGVIGGFVVGYLWPVHIEDEDEEDFDPEAERRTMLLGGAAAWRRSSQKGKETAVIQDDPEAARKTQLMDDDDSTTG